MALVCQNCGAWMRPNIELESSTARCPECSHVESRRFLPLFVVTGASGAGKTAVVPHLQRLLLEWDVFETDILWDSGGDWQTIKCNWLRVAHHLHQSGRPVLLCGTMLPDELARCELPAFFPVIHFLALYCDPEILAARLRARPSWRGFDEARITEHQAFARWFLEHAYDAFDPPLTVLNASEAEPAATAQQIADWAIARWAD